MTLNRDQEQLISDFSVHARRYCSLIENMNSMKPNQFVMEVAGSLGSLFNLGIKLMQINVEVESSDLPEELKIRPVPVDLFNQIDKKFGEYYAYSLCGDPYEDPELLKTQIGDDLADIYGDLKEGLTLFDEGTEKSRKEAVWEWSFSFRTHWGEHLAHAIGPLYYLVKYDLPN